MYLSRSLGAITILVVLSGCSPANVGHSAASIFLSDIFGEESRQGVRRDFELARTTPEEPKAWCVDGESGWIRTVSPGAICDETELKFLRRSDAEARAQAIGGQYDVVRICLWNGAKTSSSLYARQLSSKQVCEPKDLEFTTIRAAFRGIDKLQKQ